MEPERTLLLATRNVGKAAEFRGLLPPDITVLTLEDTSLTMPPETGETFVANAIAKAVFAASRTGLLTLADDSGLEVDALDGAPGVQSARYAGTPQSDARNREKLLAAMLSIPQKNRTARFRCVVALVRGENVLAICEGMRDGHIAAVPAGEAGFGYDSLFVLPGGQTMAELSMDDKSIVSHRGEAYRCVLPRLQHELATLAAPRQEEGQCRPQR